MDERTFQRELVQLKLRVDDMAYQLSKAAADNDGDNNLRRHGRTNMVQDSRSHTGSAPPMPLSWYAESRRGLPAALPCVLTSVLFQVAGQFPAIRVAPS